MKKEVLDRPLIHIRTKLNGLLPDPYLILPPVDTLGCFGAILLPNQQTNSHTGLKMHPLLLFLLWFAEICHVQQDSCSTSSCPTLTTFSSSSYC